MTWIFSPFFYLYVLSTIISFFLVVYTFRRRFMPGAKAVTWIMISISFWTFFGALEISVQDPEWKTIFSKIQYFGIVSVSPLWLIFVAEFIETKNRFLNGAYRLLLCIIPLATIFLVLTNESHNLIWSSLSLENTTWGVFQIYGHGPGFYLHMVNAYVLLLIGTIILIRYILTSGKYQGKQIISVMIAAFAPWIINALYLFVPKLFMGIEPTPLAFTLTGVLLAFSIFKFQLFELVPHAKKILYLTLDIGFVILDKNNVIVEANPAAQKILGTNLIMGMDIRNVLGAYPKEFTDLLDQDSSKKEVLLSNLFPNVWIEVTLHQINKEGTQKDSGKLLVLHDISKRKNYEKHILESQVNLSVVIENTEDTITYLDQNQKLLLFNGAYSRLIKKAYNVDIQIGMSALDFLPPEEKEWWSANNQKGLRGDRFTAEFQKDIGGETRYFETSFNPILFEGQLTGVSDFTRDITDRKKTEKELELKVKEFERINKVMIDRELKMIELKKEIKDNQTQTQV